MENETQNVDVDALLEQVEAPAGEIPMSAPPETPAQTQAQQEFEFSWNGKNIKAPLDKFTKFASQGYDYSQKMSEFNRQRMEFEQQQKAWTPIKEVEDFARSNPDWWKHVSTAYQQAKQGNNQQQQSLGEVPQDLLGVIDPLKSKLDELDTWRNTVEQERVAYQRQQEDQALDSEVKSIRESHKDLDFDRVDEEGLTLETKVLKHAVDNGIKSFKTAFRDYMADELVKRAESRGREAAVKERQENAKRGLLGKTQAPTKGITPVQNHRNRSYDDIKNDALRELGIS